MSVLKGCLVLNESAVLEHFDKDAEFVKFNGRSSKKFVLWISDRFHSQHKTCAQLIEDCSGSWKIVGKDKFKTCKSTKLVLITSDARETVGIVAKRLGTAEPFKGVNVMGLGTCFLGTGFLGTGLLGTGFLGIGFSESAQLLLSLGGRLDPLHSTGPGTLAC